MSELNEELMEEETTEAAFDVTDDEKAEWCMAKIREHRQEIDKWTQHYEAEKKRVCIKHENAIIKLEGMLKGFFFQQDDAGLTRETKTMTAYNLPDGRLMMKRQNPEYERDDEQILAWLRENAPQFIKTKETVDWAGLKDSLGVLGENMVTEEAEVVPGIKVVSRPDIFKVEVK